MRPLSEFIDNSVDDAVGVSRRRLRSVPAQAGPVPVRGPGRPLALGRDARARLGGAVRALLDAPGLDGATDAVRLSVVVLAARTPSASGVVEIRTGELGRWLGMSASYIASEVVPGLRRSGVVAVDTAEGEFGQHSGLECRVLPLWEARMTAGHPLGLRRTEFATLLRLLEAVMAPGWAHRDGSVTPAGLLGSRTGRGAATDRLALLLLVLEATETGRVRQCGGAVDTKRGRAAATVARLLGCTASAGERVLERLEDRGLVQRVRLQTASGLAHRSRLMVPAVAAAHGLSGVAVSQGERATVSDPVLSEPDVAAGAIELPEPEAEPQVSGAPVPGEGDGAEPDVAAPLHTDHSPVVTPVSSPALSGGFSGQGRGGEGHVPERACVREDQAVDGDAGPRLSLVDGEGGPLRGEEPKKSPSVSRKKGGERPVTAGKARTVGSSGQRRQQGGRVPPPPSDLLAVLAPVQLLWERLDRPFARRLVEAAVRAELVTVTGFVGRADAADVLADRLSRRLAEQNRLQGPVKDPVGWLIGRGLPQRQVCGDVRCDEGLRLDTSGDCETCEYVVSDRRALRHRIAAVVDAEMPRASESERRTETERRLNEAAASEGWTKVWYRGQVESERRAAATKARAEDEAVQAAVVEPVAPAAVVLPAPRPAAAPQPEAEDFDQGLVLEDLTPHQISCWRVRAMKDHQVVFDHIDTHGEISARRLFTHQLVNQVQRLAGTHHLVLAHTTWGQA